jgi:glycyl-tRNA synthetase beta chain
MSGLDRLARVAALQTFIATDDGASLLCGYRRAADILNKERWDLPRVMVSRGEQGIPQTGEEDPLSMVEEPMIAEAVAAMAKGSAVPIDAPVEELALTAALDRAEPLSAVALAGDSFTAAMTALTSLSAPLIAFLDGVTVNDPDDATRSRRLNLLARFRSAVQNVAHPAKMEDCATPAD